MVIGFCKIRYLSPLYTLWHDIPPDTINPLSLNPSRHSITPRPWHCIPPGTIYPPARRQWLISTTGSRGLSDISKHCSSHWQVTVESSLSNRHLRIATSNRHCWIVTVESSRRIVTSNRHVESSPLNRHVESPCRIVTVKSSRRIATSNRHRVTRVTGDHHHAITFVAA